MRSKPCGTAECREFREDHGDAEIGSDICALCGGEGPMNEWYEDLSEEESDKWWRGELED